MQSSQSAALLHVVGQIDAHLLEAASQRSPSAQVVQSVWAEQVVGHVAAWGGLREVLIFLFKKLGKYAHFVFRESATVSSTPEHFLRFLLLLAFWWYRYPA